MKHQDYFYFNQPYALESGGQLPGFQLHYTTLGTLNESGTNVIWVCHALTGNSDVTEWWADLFGEGKLYDPNYYFIVCANMLGSCYGSTGPLSMNPRTQTPYYHSFPVLTNRDIVGAFDLLREHLGVASVHTLIGSSLGGQQVLEWSVQQPRLFENIIVIASNALHSPWGIAFNETQRMAIEQDSTWRLNIDEAGREGMKTARAVALLSYRHYRTYLQTQSEENDEKTDRFKAASYQQYQGEKLSKRFNAYTYWYLSKAMDSHNVGRNRGGIPAALEKVEANAFLLGITSDLLFPPAEQQFIAKHISNSQFEVIDSSYGHDGFLLEFNHLRSSIRAFYRSFNISVNL